MELLGKSLVQLKKLLENKEVSAEEVLKYFDDRIAKHNPTLNAYVNTGDSHTPKDSGILNQLPIAVKDNFCTKGLKTTASTKVLEDFVPTYESTVTGKLLQNGATILGKTNMDAWAHGSSTEASDFGPSLNPWDISRVPGGSSGGSAVVVGSYLAPAAIGSETAGSIRLPAAWCGVVGLKPTYGRVSRYGAVAMGSSLDSPGPITLTVEDSALILEAIAGKDKYDATSVDAPVEKYTEEMKKGRKFTIGIAQEYFENVDEDITKAVEEAVKLFEKMGHKVKKVKMIPPEYSISVYTIIQRAEVSSNLARYTGIRYGKDRTHFEKEAKKRTMLGAYTLAVGYYDAFYKKALKVRTLIIDDFKRVFEEVDLIVAPTTPVTALKVGESEEYPFFGEVMDQLMEPSSIAGLPAISIPVGVDRNDLPIGMQIMGNYLRESDLLDLAYQYEQETKFNGVIEKGLAKWK